MMFSAVSPRGFLINSAVICLIALLILTPRTAVADLVAMNGSEVAPNIAEIRIEEDGVRVHLEAFIGDLKHFRQIVPDDWLKSRASGRRPEEQRLADFSENGLSVRTERGGHLPVRVEKVEARKRIDRAKPWAGQKNPATGQIFPAPPKDKRVLYAELFYPFGDDKPQSLEFNPPLDEDGRPLVSMGGIVFDRGVHTTDFRYLTAPQKLVIDWDDPWYSSFENKNFRRHHKSALMTYLYIEPREVRHETLIRVRDLEDWVELGSEELKSFDAAAQAKIASTAETFFLERETARIEGNARSPSSARVEFLSVMAEGLKVVEDQRVLDAQSALVGVVLSYPVLRLPQNVEIEWNLFNSRISEIPATSIDPAGPFQSQISEKRPTFTWTNHLTSYEPPTMTPVTVGDQQNFKVPILSVVFGVLAVCLLAFAFPARGRLHKTLIIAGSVCIAAIVPAVSGATVSVGNPFAPPPSQSDASEILHAILGNIGTAYLTVDETERRGQLHHSFSEATFVDVSQEIDRALLIRVAGGGTAKVDKIEKVSLSNLSGLEGNDGFSALAEWTTQASSGHFGHNHARSVRYRALVELIEEEGVWKLHGMTVVAAKDVTA